MRGAGFRLAGAWLLALSAVACSSGAGKDDTVVADGSASDGNMPLGGDVSGPDAAETGSAETAVDIGALEAFGGDLPTLPPASLLSEHEVLAGAAQASVNPYFEPYEDSNSNHVWDEGEPFDDLDGDGKMETLWMGGFGLRNPTGLHDDLTVRAAALAVHGQLFAFVAIDSLGLGLGRIEKVRELVTTAVAGRLPLPPEHLFVAATHSHATPDSLGIFAPDGQLGWDDAYLNEVTGTAAGAILEALARFEPAELVTLSAEVGAGIVRDIDPPEIIDPHVGLLQLRRADATAIATLVSIASHPESLWSDNTELSADFPYYLRKGLEEEMGGVAIYFSSDLGLMQSPEELGEAGVERAQLVADAYLDIVLAALDGAKASAAADLLPVFSSVKVTLPLENPELFVGIAGGIIDGYKDYHYYTAKPPCDFFGCIDVPTAALRLGKEVTFIALPGEFTPELIVGGIVKPEGYAGRYPDAEPEPVLADHLVTRERFVMGLCGAEIGYVFPKMTFDPENHFSQIHGPGPSVAGHFMAAMAELLDGVNAAPGGP
jgi:hypothetical protein